MLCMQKQQKELPGEYQKPTLFLMHQWQVE